jgi:hypothetical protein
MTTVTGDFSLLRVRAMVRGPRVGGVCPSGLLGAGVGDLVVLGDKPARRTRTLAAPASAQVKASAPIAPAPVSAPPRPHSVRAGQGGSSAESAPAGPALLAAPAPDQRADAGVGHAALAQALVDAGATTKPAAVVASILSARAEGMALNRIASNMGIHHKTVSKIIDAADDLRRRLVAV